MSKLTGVFKVQTSTSTANRALSRRLNKMVSAFPANRHYAVSLLLVKFSGSEAEIPAPLKDLVSFAKISPQGEN